MPIVIIVGQQSPSKFGNGTGVTKIEWARWNFFLTGGHFTVIEGEHDLFSKHNAYHVTEVHLQKACPFIRLDGPADSPAVL